MTKGRFPDDPPWTPAERAAARGRARDRRVRRARYLHAEHDPPADRRRLLDRIVADDLNAIRLRR